MVFLGTAPCAVVLVDEKHTLHHAFPRWVGWLSALFSLLNVALQVYSHLGVSAVILASQKPTQGGCPSSAPTSPPTGAPLAGACAPLPGFDAWWSDTGAPQFVAEGAQCGVDFFQSDADGVQCLRSNFKLPSGAGWDCLGEPATAVARRAVPEC